MNVKKYKETDKLVREIRYRIDHGSYYENIGECDYRENVAIGSAFCTDKCGHCVEEDVENNTIYCSYINTEIDKQNESINELTIKLKYEQEILSKVLGMIDVKQKYYEEYNDLDPCRLKTSIYYWAHEYIKKLEEERKEFLNVLLKVAHQADFFDEMGLYVLVCQAIEKITGKSIEEVLDE